MCNAVGISINIFLHPRMEQLMAIGLKLYFKLVNLIVHYW